MVLVDWGTKVITVELSDLVLESGTTYVHDTDQFRKDLRELEASTLGLPQDDTHEHDFGRTIEGVTYARRVIIINDYRIQYPDQLITVRLEGSNNNIFGTGVIIRNQALIVPTNSAGLIENPGSSGSNTPADEVFLGAAYAESIPQIRMAVWLERAGSVITSGLVQATVSWYNPNGTLLFSASSTTPDAQGHFSINQTQSLQADVAYYAIVSVEDATGVVTAREALPTAS